MKTFSTLALLLGLCLALVTSCRAQAVEEVSFDYFHDSLAPYGTWVEVEGYGPCWSPADVDADWSPYTDGQWVYTDAGWTWVGEEPYAGIVYHYGRWILAGSQGWCWVPGYEWAPTWVSWRNNDEYVGWAPLPPEVAWEPEQGVGIWVDEVYGIGPSFYRFCHHRDFGEQHLSSVLMARTWNSAIIVQTLNITNITYNRSFGVVYCGGPSYDNACRFSAHPIVALRLDRRRDFNLRGDHQHSLLPPGKIQGNSLIVVAPRINPSNEIHGHLPKPAKVIGQNQIQHGWAGKGATGDLDSVRRIMHAEVEGRTPKTAPVRAFSQNDLRFLPGASRPASSPEPATLGIPPQVTTRPGMPASTDEMKRGTASRVSGPEQANPLPQGSPFNTSQSNPAAAINMQRQVPPFNPRPQSMSPSGLSAQRQSVSPENNPDQINAYLQRQRAEIEARNQAEKQRVQESLMRQQNAATEARQQAMIQQEGREAMARQRQERMAGQTAQSPLQDQQRQRQSQLQQQLQVQQQQQAQQAAAMTRQREERQVQVQKQAAAPFISSPQAQPQPLRPSGRKADDSDDRFKKK